MFQTLGSQLGGAIRRANIEPQVRAARTLANYRAYVARVVGAEAASRTHPLSLRNGVLTVQVADSGLLAELRTREQEAVVELGRNQNKQDELVQRIRFTILPL